MNKWMNEQTNEWMTQRMNEWLNEWTNNWMNESINQVLPLDSYTFGKLCPVQSNSNKSELLCYANFILT